MAAPSYTVQSSNQTLPLVTFLSCLLSHTAGMCLHGDLSCCHSTHWQLFCNMNSDQASLLFQVCCLTLQYVRAPAGLCGAPLVLLVLPWRPLWSSSCATKTTQLPTVQSIRTIVTVHRFVMSAASLCIGACTTKATWSSSAAVKHLQLSAVCHAYCHCVLALLPFYT